MKIWLVSLNDTGKVAFETERKALEEIKFLLENSCELDTIKCEIMEMTENRFNSLREFEGY